MSCMRGVTELSKSANYGGDNQNFVLTVGLYAMNMTTGDCLFPSFLMMKSDNHILTYCAVRTSYSRPGVYILVWERYLSPHPSENYIFFPSRDTSFFYSQRGLFALILRYFVRILTFYFPFSNFLSPFLLFPSPFFLFLLHFPPFSLRLFIFFSQNDIGWYPPPPSGVYFPIYRPLLKTLVFPLAEHLWALELGFQCGREEKVQIHALSFALNAFTFCHALFFSCFCALLFASRSLAQKGYKSAGTHLLPLHLGGKYEKKHENKGQNVKERGTKKRKIS